MDTQHSLNSKPSPRTPYPPWRRFEPAVLAELLDTVAAVNSQLLDALVDCAQSENLEFPLPGSLRGTVARLTVPERETLARCGVFLADVNLRGITRDRGIPDRRDRVLLTEQRRPWLPMDESLSLAHSVLLVSWYLIHTSPAVARVLLGITASDVAAYRELGVQEIAQIACTRPDRVRPRWSNQLEVWTYLVEGARSPATLDPRSMTLRCLQFSAASSAGLSGHLRHSAAGAFATNSRGENAANGYTVSNIDSQRSPL
jgi:hypothetical protein